MKNKIILCFLVCFILIFSIAFSILNDNAIDNDIDFDKIFYGNEYIGSVGEGDEEAYHYWYAPNSSMGVRETKNVNWSYFKQLFLAHTDWMLEYKRYESSDWTDGSDYLTIERTWNESFWKFNLIFDVPVDIYSARFTFGVDLPVLQYVEKDGYEVWINYTANATETYNVMFNWSDIASIPNLVITKGVQDDMFWFRFRRDNIPTGEQHYEFDPTFGSATPGAGWRDINDIMQGTRHIMGSIDGIADSMSGYIRYLGFGSPKAKFALYDTSANLVGATGEVAITNTLGKWFTATFSEPKPSLTKNTYYFLMVISDEVGVSINGYTDAIPPPYVGREDSIAYASAFEDPATWSSTTHGNEIYCTYTEIPPVTLHLNGFHMDGGLYR